MADEIVRTELTAEDIEAAVAAYTEGQQKIAELQAALAAEKNARESSDTEQNERIAANAAAIGAAANRGAKNLLKNTMADLVVAQGVTWTKNSDDSVTATGTSTGISAVRIAGVQGLSDYNSAVPLKRGTYLVSPSGSDNQAFRLAIGVFSDSEATRQVVYVYNEPYTLIVSNDTTRIDFSALIITGNDASGYTFYPMIRDASIEDDTYVPYAEDNATLTQLIADLTVRVTALEGGT